ncbi:MAG: CZB domain-containing protein [Nitrospiraceae bacterium]|nr:CZB domain-containing protein [Nitrospiraceae bacterium]
MLELAKSDHRNFVGKIGSCVRGEAAIDPASLPDHHSCRFGKWYGNGGMQLCGTMSSFKAIDPPHERIHQVARQAVEAASSGNRTRAEELFNEVERLSVRITEEIDRAKIECLETQA